MHEEFKNAIRTCIFTDDGIWLIGSTEQDGLKDLFFPYGSIKKIKFGKVLGILEVIGKNKNFIYATQINQRSRIKELIKFAESKMKTAPPAEPIECIFNHPCHAQEEFYKKCNEANVCLGKKSSKADIERAKLIAKQNNLVIDEENILEEYLIGKFEIERIAENEYYKSLFNQAKELEKFASYHGRDKEIFVAQEMAELYKAVWEHLALGKSLPVQKEHDWAILGGIASGIAGGAAGVAVAADCQIKNAEIRAHNQQMRKNYARAVLPGLTKASELKEEWTAKLEKAKIALVEDSSPDKFFDSIHLSDENVHILDDKSVVVTAKAVIPNVKIFDTVNAYIDGSLIATVTQNGKVIGQGIMVIPNSGKLAGMNGKVCTEYSLVGACTGKAESDAECEVVIKCRDLWAVER